MKLDQSTVRRATAQTYTDEFCLLIIKQTNNTQSYFNHAGKNQELRKVLEEDVRKLDF